MKTRSIKEIELLVMNEAQEIMERHHKYLKEDNIKLTEYPESQIQALRFHMSIYIDDCTELREKVIKIQEQMRENFQKWSHGEEF